MNSPTQLLQRLLGRLPSVPDEREYSVDELAQAGETTVRNVRAYQDKGLLPPPERRGRVGVYRGEHLARLRLIGQLLERGYTIASIRELFDAWEKGQGLAHVLGLDEAIRGTAQPEAVATLGFDELQAIFGEALDDEIIDRSTELELLEVAGDHLRVNSPRLFAAGVQLHQAGLPLTALLDELIAIRGHVEQLSTGIVQLIVANLVNPLLTSSLPRVDELEGLSRQIHALRPLVEQVVEAELARALPLVAERELSGRVQQLLEGFLQPVRPTAD